jgi:hypothetical protein
MYNGVHLVAHTLDGTSSRRTLEVQRSSPASTFNTYYTYLLAL